MTFFITTLVLLIKCLALATLFYLTVGVAVSFGMLAMFVTSGRAGLWHTMLNKLLKQDHETELSPRLTTVVLVLMGVFMWPAILAG